LNQLYTDKVRDIEEKALAQKLRGETIDVTLPGKRPPMGKLHPLTTVFNQITEIFLGMGFDVAEGPEVELDYYNFEALEYTKKSPCPGYSGYLLYK
jgi:phenylalanyl-tRNA synthetase alpha chain